LNAWKRLVAYASTEQFLIGASLFRLVAGATILLEYLVNYAQRGYLHGPRGVVAFDEFLGYLPAFRLYGLSASTAYFEVLYHAGVLLSVLWLVGWKTRWITPIHYLFFASLHQRNFLLWDGGDNVMQVVFVYACFARLDAHFSVSPETPKGGDLAQDVRAMTHNAAMLAFAIQICLVYGIAGLTKVQGEVWRNGTALYYALRASEFTWPGKSEFIFHNAGLVTALSYAAVAFQVSFTFLLFLNRWTRRFAVAAGVCFHVGIAVFMGLVSFAMFMMAVDVALVSDDDYRKISGLGRRWVDRFARRLLRSPPSRRPGQPDGVTDMG
jgi:antimicrobial peptide system SdpB family protein